MASTQEPEVQLAQKLASNEKPIRTKAIKKLRKYINVRSQKATGGFTGDELLKLWKGLFYCLWMQDKPLLQEEISHQISTLIHSFQNTDAQFLYLESFLQTFKREWTGIDRLRMDKFFQLVRFMFRQTFEMLKRKDWESSVVGSFLELLVAQLLQTGSAAPSGLQFHILDLYMTELAAVGSAELTADQNLTLIGPFCKAAAKTKDRTLFGAICNSIFSTIIDQAPFAIEDLMKEIKMAEDSDSGQASEEDCEDHGEEEKSKRLGKKGTGKQINGRKSNDEEEEEDEEDELLQDEEDTELPCDEDIGPVLQFDYTALADKLVELASRSSTPSHNRQRLYKIIKVLRDLSEGIFPQDEYPEEVSTDEDDDMFGSRKRMKRGGRMEEEEEGTPPAKKKKGKKEASAANAQSKGTKDESAPADQATTDESKKKKKKKKRKKKKEVKPDASEEKAGAQAGDPKDPKEVEVESLSSSVKVTEGESDTPTPSELKDQPSADATEDAGQPGDDAPDSGKKKKKKRNKKGLDQTDGAEACAEAEVTSASCEASRAEAGNATDLPPTEGEGKPEEPAETVTPASKKGKKKKKSIKASALTEVDGEIAFAAREHEDQEHKDQGLGDEGLATPQEEPETPAAEVTPQGADVLDLTAEITTATPAKKKKKTPKRAAEHGGGDTGLPAGESEATSTKKRKIPVTFEFEADELEAALTNGLAEEDTTQANDAEEPSTPVRAKKSQKKAKASEFITFQSNAAAPAPLFCKVKGSPRTPLSGKKKKQSPKSESKKVTFGLKNNKTTEFRKTDRSLLVTPDGSSRVPFDPTQKPKFGVLKSPPTPLSAKKTHRKTSVSTPKSTPKRRPSAADFF